MGTRQKDILSGFRSLLYNPPAVRLVGLISLRRSIELPPGVQIYVTHRTNKITTYLNSNRKLWRYSARSDRSFPNPVKLRGHTANLGGEEGWVFVIVCPVDTANVIARWKPFALAEAHLAAHMDSIPSLPRRLERDAW